MKITLTELITGSYKADIEGFDVMLIDQYYDNQAMLQLIAAEVATMLDMRVAQVTKWEGDPDGSTIDRDPSKVDPYNWHNDGTHRMDTVMLIYFTDPPLTEATGGRLGIRDLADPASEQLCDVQDCTIVIQCQADKRFEHYVETGVPGAIRKRRVVDFGLNGWNESSVLGPLTNLG